MKGPASVDFDAIAHGFDARSVRWLLIGGQAVRVYGGTRLTHDFDVWVDPDRREDCLRFLRDDLGLELSAEPEDRMKPIVKAIGTGERVDVFAPRAMTNLEGTVLAFADLYARSRLFRDEEFRLDVHLPALDDLIALKKMRQNSDRDAEDLRFLLARQDLEAKGEL